MRSKGFPRLILFVGSALALVLGSARPAGAQSLSNTTFDTDVAGWIPSEALVEWNALDVHDSLESGSALVTNTSSTPLDGTGAYQCLNGVQEGETIWLSGYARIPSGQVESGNASILMQKYASADCQTSLGSEFTSTLSSSLVDTWRWIGGSFDAPSGLQSVRIRMTVLKTESEGTLSAYFDSLSLIQGIFVDGFEVGDTGIWSSTQP